MFKVTFPLFPRFDLDSWGSDENDNIPGAVYLDYLMF